MENKKGSVLAINTGSTSTKVGYYVDGNTVLVRNLELSAQEVLRFDSVLEQGDLRRGIVMDFLRDAGVGGLPDFPHRAFFHALNSRAVVRRYLREHRHATNDITAIVAHMGGRITVTLHQDGKVIDTNNGRGGAVAFFGTNDLRELERRAADDPKVDTWLDAFGLNVAKYIASLATTVDGKVDVILLTGGIARDSRIVADIRRRTAFIAPTEVYPGENELDSLAENGYLILAGSAKIHRYDKNRLLEDEETVKVIRP